MESFCDSQSSFPLSTFRKCSNLGGKEERQFDCGMNVHTGRNKDISSLIVSPDSKEQVESCTGIMSFGYHHDEENREPKRSKVDKPLFQSKTLGLSFSPETNQHGVLMHNHHRPGVASFHHNHNVDSARMSPNSEFNKHDSSCKPIDQAQNTFDTHLSESLHMPVPLGMNPQHISYHVDSFRQRLNPSFSDPYNMAHRQVQRINSNFLSLGSRRRDAIHNDSRGAFDIHWQPDPNDEEVEHILSEKQSRKWQQNEWRDHYFQIHHFQQQCPYIQCSPLIYHGGTGANFIHPYPTYNPPHQFYDPIYPQLNSHLMYGYDITNDVPVPCYHQSNYNYFTNTHNQQYSKSRKRKCVDESVSPTSSGQKFYIFTDRPVSPMSDISSSPVPSFDETETFVNPDRLIDENNIKHQTSSLSKNLTKPSRSRKRLSIDTTFDESNIKHAEPKNPRRKGKSSSNFVFNGNAILRTVSPLKGKSEGEKRDRKGGEIWRCKSDISNLVITNNISQTSSE